MAKTVIYFRKNFCQRYFTWPQLPLSIRIVQMSIQCPFTTNVIVIGKFGGITKVSKVPHFQYFCSIDGFFLLLNFTLLDHRDHGEASGISHRRCSLKKVFLKIFLNSQNVQIHTCTKVSFLIKLRYATLLKNRLWHRCFPVYFAKFLRIPFYRTPLNKFLHNALC